MRGQIVRLLLAGVLAIPPVRFVILESTTSEVDRTSAAWRAREAVIARAQVFVTAPPSIPSLDLTANPADPSPLPGDEIACRYAPKNTNATSPKFDCRLPDGGVIKVKYGDTPERMGEVAATRLLAALGFPADHVSFVRRLRCEGCSPYPFQVRRIAEWFLIGPVVDRIAAHSGTREFEWVAVERKMAGRALELEHYEGWDWWELDLVSPEHGGAPAADLDALRLMVVFLGHWDNKAPNQRLLCSRTADPEATPDTCDVPLLMLQDVGATFGPTKVQYAPWRDTPIWKDEAACVVSLETLPYGGAGFRPVRISEAGRLRLGGRLSQLSESQITQLFTGARFPDPATGAPDGDVRPWVRAFQQKVRSIVDRPPCPSFPQ